MKYPDAIAVDNADNLYVSNQSSRTINKIDTGGAVLRVGCAVPGVACAVLVVDCAVLGAACAVLK